MRLGSIQRQKRYGMKKSDPRRLWSVGVLGDVWVPFVGTGVGGRRGTCVEANRPISRLIEGWEEGFIVFIYTPVFTFVSM